MTSKRILVVDDDPDLLFLVAHGIRSLQPDYQVITAVEGASALYQAQKQRFDLVVTDYMMPEMTGLDLIREIRRATPETYFIMMTAHHDTQRIKSIVGDMELNGFVSKPFTMPELLETVQRVMQQVDVAGEVTPIEEAAPKVAISQLLQTLQGQIGAHHILLVNANGSPVQWAGKIDRAKVTRLANFVAANFLAITELANLFGDHESVFKSSYYEGNKYNIYAYDINGSFFLAVVIGADSKPGALWFYTRQAAVELASLLPPFERKQTPDTGGTIAADFDDLFGNRKDVGND